MKKRGGFKLTSEEEDCMGISFGTFSEYLLQIFSPFNRRVALTYLYLQVHEAMQVSSHRRQLRDFTNLEHFILWHIRCKSCERLSATATHTHKEGVASWLLDDTTDTTHMLYSKPVPIDVYWVVSLTKTCTRRRVQRRKLYVPEEHKVHWFLADVIVLIEVILYHQSQFVYIHHLCVGLGIVLWVHKVTEHEAA